VLPENGLASVIHHSCPFHTRLQGFGRIEANRALRWSSLFELQRLDVCLLFGYKTRVTEHDNGTRMPGESRGVRPGKIGPAEFVTAGLDPAIHTATPPRGESAWTTGIGERSDAVSTKRLCPVATRPHSARTIEIALAQIAVAFSCAAEINSFKFRVERWLRLGPEHPAVRARFRARTAALPQWQLDAAIREVERWWARGAQGFRARQRARLRLATADRGTPRATADLAVDSFQRDGAEFEAIAAAVYEHDIALAAE
jgi:hypothetical protein